MKKGFLLIFLGLLIGVFLLELGLRVAGFTHLYLLEQENVPPFKNKDSCKILFFGNFVANEFPTYLKNELNDRKPDIKFNVIFRGKYGQNTNGLLANLENDLNKFKPDMVITMAGSNDGKSDVIAYEYEPIRSYYKELKAFKLMILIRDVLSYLRLSGNNANTGGYGTAEQQYKKTIELNPKSEQRYMRLGDWSLEQGKYEEAESLYRKAIEMNPEDSQGYMKLGDCYSEQRNYKESEESFRKATDKLNPKDEQEYMNLGYSYMQIWKYIKAESMYEKAIDLNPKNELAYLNLGDCCIAQQRYKEAEDAYKKVSGLNPKNRQVYLKLVDCYSKQRKFKEAVRQYRKAVELNPEQDKTFYFISDMCYFEPENRFEECMKFKEHFKQDYINAIGPGENIKEAGEINIRCRLIEDEEEQTKYLYFNAGTIYNYKKLWNMLKERNISYVCVQYPMRKVEDLKGIFKHDKGIIFVDNEEIFRDNIEKEGYAAYFWDKTKKEFGHFTPKSNKLLARNIADTIIKEAFYER